MLPSVFLIVLCYHGIELTLDCLASLRQQDYPACTTLVIDNASHDGTAAQIAENYPGVEVISTGANLGSRDTDRHLACALTGRWGRYDLAARQVAFGDCQLPG